jgi:3-hydroxybutyryl-CoA dehydratase
MRRAVHIARALGIGEILSTFEWYDPKIMSEGGARVLSFDELSVGQRAELRVVLTPELIDAFARLTGDLNPLHVSDDFARARGFSARLAHGLLTAAFFSAIAGMLLPGRDCLLQSARFDFRKPAPAGTALTLEAVVVQKIDAVRAIVLEISARDAAGEVVLSGRIQAGLSA